eukprot:1157523-Pelagomonas_calceolata.AAC.4
MNYDDLHLPAIVSAAYGAGTFKPKMIVLLRDPIERLHSAFYGYAHYQKYGHTPEGFLKYVKEQVGEIKDCAKRHTAQTILVYCLRRVGLPACTFIAALEESTHQTPYAEGVVAAAALTLCSFVGFIFACNSKEEKWKCDLNASSALRRCLFRTALG